MWNTKQDILNNSFFIYKMKARCKIRPQWF